MLALRENWDKLSVSARQDKLMELQRICKDAEDGKIKGLKKADITLNEYFADGVYAREISVRAGTTLVGDIHLKEHLNILSKGSIRVVTDQGTKVLKAPCTFISPAGVKRAGYVLTDMVWTTFHATKLKNETAIRKEFIASSYEEYNNRLGVKT